MRKGDFFGSVSATVWYVLDSGVSFLIPLIRKEPESRG
jgi:hypothetical protein